MTNLNYNAITNKPDLTVYASNNKTNFSNLVVSGASTLLSSLNVSGNIIGSGSALTNLNYNAILNPPSIISLNNPATFISTLNISGSTTLNRASTCMSTLNVVGDISTSGLSVSVPSHVW